jgi:hypothetical protein
LTASSLGAAWKKSATGAQTYSELDGLVRIAIAVRGKYLFASNDPETLVAVLDRMNQRVSAEPALYYSGFDHSRERQNFYALTSLVDRPSRTNSTFGDREPEFFSQNVASLSKALAGVSSESVVARRENGVEKQTVLYKWAQ